MSKLSHSNDATLMLEIMLPRQCNINDKKARAGSLFSDDAKSFQHAAIFNLLTKNGLQFAADMVTNMSLANMLPAAVEPQHLY
jgi:hypothetical protein